jgi:hypothetical protein
MCRTPEKVQLKKRRSKVRYYLYAESMMDEDGIPVSEHMKVYEKYNVRQAAQACMEEIHSWMQPKLEECLEGENCACIYLSIGGQETLSL